MPDSRAQHDIANQLTIILGFSEILLADTGPEDPRRGDLEEIYKAAVIALQVVEGERVAHRSSTADPRSRR